MKAVMATKHFFQLWYHVILMYELHDRNATVIFGLVVG